MEPFSNFIRAQMDGQAVKEREQHHLLVLLCHPSTSSCFYLVGINKVLIGKYRPGVQVKLFSAGFGRHQTPSKAKVATLVDKIKSHNRRFVNVSMATATTGHP